MPPSVAHNAFGKYFQHGGDDDSGKGRVATVGEVWGSLVLASLTDVNAKVRFLFRLHDKNGDRRMNKIEVIAAPPSQPCVRASH